MLDAAVFGVERDGAGGVHQGLSGKNEWASTEGWETAVVVGELLLGCSVCREPRLRERASVGQSCVLSRSPLDSSWINAQEEA